MPLNDVTYGSRKVCPKKARAPYVDVVERKLPANSWAMVNRILDEALDELVDMLDAENKLVWTKTGALVGHSSKRPKHDIDRLWDRIVSCVGDDKECLITMGALVRWKISQRAEDWLCYVQKTDDHDPETGKQISVTHYWINKETAAA